MIESQRKRGQMSKIKGQVVQAVRISDSDFGRVVGKSLRTLRELSGLTQHDLASRLDISQGAVSKIETRGDVQLSCLRHYVEALGATLRVGAAFSPSAARALKFESAFDPELQSDDQLVFPLFEDELFKARRDVVLSVRPLYSEKIMDGKKTIELRRRFPISAPRGTIAYIYSTSPVRAMVGVAEINTVAKLRVSDIWKKYAKMAHIARSDFDEYFLGLSHGFALKFAKARRFNKPIALAELRDRFGFEPPQSYLYASHVLRTALQDECSNLSD